MPRAHKYRSPSFETADLTPYLLPEDEPLSSKIIEMNQKLAYAVIALALDDLACRDELDAGMLNSSAYPVLPPTMSCACCGWVGSEWKKKHLLMQLEPVCAGSLSVNIMKSKV